MESAETTEPTGPAQEAEPGDILREVDKLLSSLQSHPDPLVRTQVDELLQGIDLVHRTGLSHLMAAIHGMGGDALVNRLVGDPAIRLLLMSYGLVAVDRRIQAEEALDAVRGHLHARRIDIEIKDVVGGVVYIKLHGLEQGGVAEEAVLHDIETALKEGFIGFQELVARDRNQARDMASELIPLSSLKRMKKPVFERALALSDLTPGAVKGVELLGQPVLLVNLAGEIHALRNRCADSPLPLEFSPIEGETLRCSWHGCVYDIRTGRCDALGHRLSVYPVQIKDGDILVALGVEAAGH